MGLEAHQASVCVSPCRRACSWSWETRCSPPLATACAYVRRGEPKARSRKYLAAQAQAAGEGGEQQWLAGNNRDAFVFEVVPDAMALEGP